MRAGEWFLVASCLFNTAGLVLVGLAIKNINKAISAILQITHIHGEMLFGAENTERMKNVVKNERSPS